jgi:hypothetical protein
MPLSLPPNHAQTRPTTTTIGTAAIGSTSRNTRNRPISTSTNVGSVLMPLIAPMTKRSSTPASIAPATAGGIRSIRVVNGLSAALSRISRAAKMNAPTA